MKKKYIAPIIKIFNISKHPILVMSPPHKPGGPDKPDSPGSHGGPGGPGGNLPSNPNYNIWDKLW